MGKLLNAVAFRIVVVFIVFDGIRSNLLATGVLSLIREGVLLYLVSQVILIEGFKKLKVGYSIILFLSYHSVVSLFSLFNEGPVEIGFIIKPFEFVAAIYVFYFYEKLTGKKLYFLIKYIINTSVVFCVINSLLYFIPLPIWNREIFWWGRISCGYPTMDVVTLSYSLTLLLYYPFLNYRKLIKICYTFIIVIEILLNASGTGLLLVCMVLSSLFFVKKWNMSNVVVTVFLFLLGVLMIALFANKFPKEYEIGRELIENKTAIILGNEVTNNTLEIRKQQYQSVEKRQNLLTKVTGMGINYLVMDLKKIKPTQKNYHIENQYGILLIGYGFVGMFLYLLIMLEYLFLIIQIHVSYKVKMAFGLCIMIWAANSGTLITMMLFSNSIYLALILSVIYKFYFYMRQVTAFENNRFLKLFITKI